MPVMNFLKALLMVSALTALAAISVNFAAMRFFLAVMVPYAAIALFLIGIMARVWQWAGAPVPFRIPTTCGQQASLPWIKSGRLESPHTQLGVIGRMALEILLFRSLFRNVKADLRPGGTLVYGEEKFLWLGALAFHWSLLIVVLRHMRFFMEPVPGFVAGLQQLDGFFQVGLPVLYVTDVVFISALAYLLLRRLFQAQLRYISLVSDYLALVLLLGVVSSGILMRYFVKADILPVKEMALGIVTLSPRTPPDAGVFFYVHFFLVSGLLAYFPFSKLVHMAGVFLSPTRNLPNNNRMKRHINPWNHPVRIHSYEEWEDEFRDKIKVAGLPLERP
jgi:nitrate reductase gamma subunit